jgi:hypothetical protein
MQLADLPKTSPAALINRLKDEFEGDEAVKEAGLVMSDPRKLSVTSAYRLYATSQTPQLYLFL